MEKILNLLHESGLLYKNRLLLHYACKGLKTEDYTQLRGFLDRNPGILRKASELIKARQQMKEIFPFELPSSDNFSGHIPVGIINEKNETFNLSEKDLTRHTLVNGSTGSGKTVFTGQVINSLQTHSPETTVWVFEPKREYRPLSSYNNFIVITPKNFRQNFFEPPTLNMNPSDWAQVVSEIIQLEGRFMTYSKNILFDILMKLYRNKGVLEGSQNYPTVRDVQNYLAGCEKKARENRSYREADNYMTLLNRFLDFVNLGSVFDVQHSIPIEEMMRKNIVFEIENLKSETYSTIASVLLNKAFFYRFYHEPKHIILTVIEEARKVFSAKRDRDYAVTSDPPLIDMMTKSRAKKMGFYLVTQEPGSISNVAKSNVATQVMLKLADGKDYEAAARSMSLSKPQVEFARKMDIGMGICRYIDYPEPFAIQIPYLPLDTEPTDKEIEEKAMRWFDKIRYKTEQPTEPQEAEEPKPEEPDEDEIPPDAMKLMFGIEKMPGRTFKDTIAEVELHSSKGEKARKWLEENGYIIVHNDIKTSKRHRGMVMELTEKGLEKTGGKPLKGKGSFKHRCYAHYIATYLKKNGFSAVVEKYVNGKHVDVYCEGAAYEITIHLENVIENIQKNQSAGIEDNVIVVEDTATKKKVSKMLKKADVQADIKLIGEYL
jgi:hypothetical protein